MPSSGRLMRSRRARARRSASIARASSTVAGRRPMSSVICRAFAISSPLELAISPLGRYRLSSRPTRIEPPRVSAAATSIHWSREMPITPQCEPAGMFSTIAARLRAVGGMPPIDAHHAVHVQRGLQHAHVDQRREAADVADVEALVLGFDVQLVHRLEQLDDLVERVCEDHLEDEVLARARVLGVVHRAHVQRRHLRAAGAQIFDPLLHRDADRAGRVVDDHRVADLGADRVGDRLEVLDLIARRAVRAARVDVDHHAALVHDPPRLGRVLLGRVGNRRALLAIGDRPGDRAGDDDGILEAHTGTTPWRFHGRSMRLPSAISSARQIVGRVSRGSITSSIMSLPAAMYTSMILR